MTGKDRKSMHNKKCNAMKNKLENWEFRRKIYSALARGDGITKYKSPVGIWRGGTGWTPNDTIVADLVGYKIRVDENMLAHRTKQQKKIEGKSCLLQDKRLGVRNQRKKKIQSCT